MRHFDFAPLYRSTVGFDRLASILDQVMSADVGTNTYPPYNIEKTGEDAYRITLAVAGFAEDELSIEARDGQLVVTGRKAETEDKATVLHRGIATRAFERRFQLADHVRVAEAVSRERPPAHRPRARGARGAEAAQGRDRPRQGDRGPGRRGLTRLSTSRR